MSAGHPSIRDDRQNERIVEQLVFFSPAIKLLLELKRFATSPQFLEELLTSVGEARGDKADE
jgi:hypothetical protein